MLSRSNTPLDEALPYFTRPAVDVALLVPTETGLSKYIMDATAPFRQFLDRHSLHDFDSQEQGQDRKVKVPALFVGPTTDTMTVASLYRPSTKQGDPRVWFSNLGRYCSPFDLLAVATDGTTLFVFNMSSMELRASLERGHAAQIVRSLSEGPSDVAQELLGKLRTIHEMGFVDTFVPGDTGVGKTLERLLGIPPNSNPIPDYKGIELKSGRSARPGRAKTRATIFSKAPDWNASRISSRQELLREYGYARNGRLNLNCSLRASRPNAQGLFLTVDDDSDLLRTLADGTPIKDVVQWAMPILRKCLTDKHPETFWIQADCRGQGSGEQFHYQQAIHTRTPNVNLLGDLISADMVELDFLLHQKPGKAPRDHGWLFKMHHRNLDLMFPSPMVYDLASV